MHTCVHDTYTHTAKTPNTGMWGVRALGAGMAEQGGGRRSCWSHSVPATLEAPETSSLQHLPPGLRQLQGQRTTKGKGS